jgi:hypothetical protein
VVFNEVLYNFPARPVGGGARSDRTKAEQGGYTLLDIVMIFEAFALFKVPRSQIPQLDSLELKS